MCTGPARRVAPCTGRPLRHARPGAGYRRWAAGILERVAGGVPRDPRRPLLVPQDRQRAGRAAQVRAPWGEKALAEIWNAEDKDHARAAVNAFEAAYGARFPKATAKITDDADDLLAFYDYPSEHWVHLRATNPIESTFASVRHRTKVTRGRARGRPGWRWHSSSSRQPRTAGAP